MIKEIVFDMDGTIADLYGQENWLTDLQNGNPTPYTQAKPLCDMVKLVAILKMLQANGTKVRIVSWLAMNSTQTYKDQVRQAKLEWLETYGFPYDNCNIVSYGTKKQNCIRNKEIFGNEYILIDDSQEVRETWNIGRAINPTETDIVKFLESLA